jgi:hypothetical protein
MKLGLVYLTHSTTDGLELLTGSAANNKVTTDELKAAALSTAVQP